MTKNILIINPDMSEANGEKDKFYVTNSHPAIISREVFEAAQHRLKEREQYAPKKPKQ